MELNISLAPEILFEIAGFPVTNAFVWMLAISLFFVLVSLFITRGLKMVPGPLQNIAELFFEGAWGFVKNTVGSDKKTARIFPLVFTIFIFILLCNLFTYIPGQSAVILAREEGSTAVFRSVMSDYGLVFLMTMIAIIIVQIVAIAVNGPLRYIGKFFNFRGVKEFFVSLFKGKFKPALLAQGFLDVFLGIMDLIGELAKIFSLSFRLFGNMFAGEVLGSVMLFLAPFFMPLPFMFLGLLTAFVQAFVFAVLTMVFINMASETSEEAEATS